MIGQFAFSGATQGADFSLVRPSAAQKLQRICGLDNILLVFIMKDKLHRLQDMEMTGCLFANCRREVRRLPVLRDTVIRHFLVLMAACISLGFPSNRTLLKQSCITDDSEVRGLDSKTHAWRLY